MVGKAPAPVMVTTPERVIFVSWGRVILKATVETELAGTGNVPETEILSFFEPTWLY